MRRRAAAVGLLLALAAAGASAQGATLGCAPDTPGLPNLAGGAIVSFEFYDFALSSACLSSLVVNSTANCAALAPPPAPAPAQTAAASPPRLLPAANATAVRAVATGGSLLGTLTPGAFVDVAGDGGAVAVSVAGATYVESFGGSPPRAAAVRLIVKTPVVYAQGGELSLLYVVSDAAGRTACAPASSVTVTAAGVSAPCAAFGAASPAAACSLALPPSAFRTDAPSTATVTVTVTYGPAASVSASAGVTRAQATTAAMAQATVGVYAVLPDGPAYVGDTVSVALWASTGGAQLTTWAVSVAYNASALTYAGVSAPLYNTPVTNDANGVVTAISVGVPASTSAAATTGWVNVANVSFSVGARAAGASLGFAGTVGQLVAASTATIARNSVMTFFGAGVLGVAAPAVAGLYAAAGAPTLLNTAALTGVAVTDTLAVWATYAAPASRAAAYPDVQVAPDRCETAAAAALTVQATPTGCLVSAGAGATAGAAGALVRATVAGVGAVNATYRVYLPANFTAYASRATLAPIGACPSQQFYESAALAVMADLHLDAALPAFIAPPAVDVTRFVTFASRTPAVATVSGNVVTGVAPGTAVIAAAGAGAVAVVVAATATAPAPTLQTVVAASAAAAVASATALPELGRVTVGVATSARPALNAEGAVASMATFLVGADGVYTDVSALPGLAVTSLTPSNLGVAAGQAFVPQNAASLVSGPWLAATLADACGNTIATGTGTVSTSLSSATSLSVTLTPAAAAATGSLAAAAGVPSAATIGVTIFFADGSSRVMTGDARTAYAPSCGTVTGGVLTVDDSCAPGDLSVNVSFPTYPAAAGLSGAAALTVLDGAGLAVSASATTLRALACTGTFETAALNATLRLTNGDAVAVPAKFTSLTPAVVSVVGATATGVASGTAYVYAKWLSASAVVQVVVASGAATVTSARLAYPTSTLSGSATPVVSLSFSDGTTVPDAAAAFGAAKLASMVSFSSSDNASVAVASDGTATAAADGTAPATVTVTVAPACAVAGAPLTGNTQLTGNVAPAVGGVKLGALTGVALPAVPAGGALVVPVTLNAGADALLAWQLDVYYNATLHAAPSVAAGAQWAGGLFDYNVPAPGHLVLSGSDASGGAAGLVTVATITLPALGAASPATETLTSSLSVFTVRTQSGGVHALQLAPSSNPATAVLGGRRRLAAAAPPGDCNGDGAFDANDVLFAQLVIVGAAPAPADARECAPTLSYLGMASPIAAPTPADAQYLLGAVVQKLLFLRLGSAAELAPTPAPAGVGGAWTLSATLLDHAGKPADCGATSVFFEVSVQAPLAVTTGARVQSGAAGDAVIRAVCGPPGVFAAALNVSEAPTYQAAVGYETPFAR